MGECEEFRDDSGKDTRVRGFLHRAAGTVSDCLVLTHGAGANCQSPLLRALAEAFRAAGVSVLRCDLPFRQARPHGPPPRGSAERGPGGLRAAVAAMRREACGRIFLGGHSYGGRQASMLAAEAPGLVDAAAAALVSVASAAEAGADAHDALPFSRNSGIVCKRRAGWVWNEGGDGGGAEVGSGADRATDDSGSGTRVDDAA